MSRALAAALWVALIAWASSPAPSTAGAAETYPPRYAVSLDPLWSGLPALSGIAHAGDDRLFLTTLDGRVLVYQDGAVREDPVLDLRHQVSTGGEHGLLGLAFHPRHEETRELFVSYSDHDHSTVIARYRFASAEGELTGLASGVTLLAVPGFVSGHSSGQLQFGPDGYLYASIGGGPIGRDPKCDGQRLDGLRGKILRLDVDAGPGASRYAIPPSNPFAGGPTPEVWAYGLRNPWRFSFDRETGDLYVADVGEHEREEIHRQEASSPGGENYGWARMEGTFCANLVASCQEPVPPCGDAAFTPPILEHDHETGVCAVIGGYVYRGQEIPELYGRYVYGDHCSGRLFVATPGSEGWTSEELGIAVPKISSLGEDAMGELHLVTTTGLLARLSAWPGRSPHRCVPGEERLCLGGGRYQVAARWRDPRGATGVAHAVALTRDSGYFWFFAESNVELVVKLLPGCRVGMPADWFFAAGLTDLAVDLRILDLDAGTERSYRHAGGAFPLVQETRAFPCDAPAGRRASPRD